MTGRHSRPVMGPRHIATPEPRTVSPAFPGTDSMEDAMSTDDGKTTSTQIPVTERYRAVILAVGGVLMSGLLVVSDALAAGRPWGGLEFVSFGVAVVTAIGVYFPGNAWAKFGAGIAGSIAQTLFATWTDDRVTSAELVVIVIAVLAAMGVGAFPNAPQLVTGEPGDDVIDEPMGGSTYRPAGDVL